MELIKYLLHRLKKNSTGAAFVELAIIIPVLLLLIVGIVEFGWIYSGYITLTGAAREGARVAAVNGDYQDAIDEHVKSQPMLSITSTQISGGENQGDDITVVLKGNVNLLVKLLTFLDDPFPLSAEATMRRQYLDENNENE